ncbi:hypothetical protein [Cytobacillus praedii]|uniref:hypothetical protein n=1 Tax=Cytobacillus praedii TaxID=1742358 RepID=UPI002E21414F|nr:hypothetical protein [Cytobacillus praedii]
MKASEALLRCIASVGGTIDSTQLDVWLGQLLKAGLIRKGEAPFTYTLTDTAKGFLQKKGVQI